MNDFYPIYKSKLKPWIKFWILKGNKIAPKVLSEVIEGTTPITIEGVYKGTSLQDLIFKGQTVQNGTPSPEAPIPVQVVKEDNIITINDGSYRVDLSGKNLFNVEQAITRMENNAGTLINDWGTYEDGIITMNRSMGYHGTTCFAGQKFNLEANKTYTLSATVYLTGTNATSNVILGFTGESNPNVTITKETWTKVSRTVSFTQYKENMRVFIQPSNTGNILQIKEIMLCEGTSTEYFPYYNYELCKIGDYQDRIYKENDKWYVEKKIGKVVLNGTENWNVNKTGTVNWFYQLQNAVSNFNYDSDHSTYLSNIGIKGNVGNTTTTQGVYILSNGGLRVRYGTEDTVANWKSFLTTTNMELYYPLLTPTTTEITETTLLSQLNALKNATLISGTNEITQTPSDLPFILNFKYYMKG